MRGWVLLNQGASGSEQFEAFRLQLLDAGFRIAVVTDGEDAQLLPARLLASGANLLVAAGGDGTVSAIVAAMLARGTTATRGCLGILPLGTGNDLARSLGIPLDVAAAVDVLLQGHVTGLDAMRVRAEADGNTAARADIVAVNVAAAGFSGEVAAEVTTEAKERWGTLAYLMGALKAWSHFEPQHASVVIDGQLVHEGELANILVANGTSIAGGTIVAPEGSPRDGWLDVAIVRPGTLVESSALAARLGLREPLGGDMVTFHRAREVLIRSDGEMLCNIDGEPMSARNISFHIIPDAVDVIVPAPEEDGTSLPDEAG